MDHFILILSAIKAVTVLVGLVFLWIALRAYLRHRTRSLFVLILAVGLMTVATVAEGAAFQALGLDLEQAHVIEAVFMLTAFIVLLASVAVPQRRKARVRPDRAHRAEDA